MKRTLLLLIMALYTVIISGQNVHYVHDAAGNRTARNGVQTFNWSRATPFAARSVLSASYLDEAPDPYRSLNTTLQVGRTEGNAGVSNLGAATYQIPIKIADGTNGMQPQISVCYDSHTGNGIMGYG